GHNIATVQEAGGHVLAGAGVALDHLVVGLEAGHGDLLDRVGLVGGLGGRDDGRVGNQGEVDTGVGHKVGLELVQVDVEGAVEPKRRGDRGDNYVSSVTAVVHTLGCPSIITACPYPPDSVSNLPCAISLLRF